jgi:DedD protein
MTRVVDRSLQERLAGAVVLVVLAVWLIPQVLDGPEEGGDRTQQTLSLPAPPEQDKQRTQTIRLDDQPTAPAAKPAPQTGDRAVKPPAPTPTVKPKRAPAPAPAPAPAAAAGWFVQLGSFAERANASRLADTVAELGFKTEVSRHSAGTAVLHRVRVGPRPSRVAAEALASDLARRGYPGQVVQDG